MPLRHAVDGTLVTLTLDRPDSPVNTLDDAFGSALTTAVDRLEADRDHLSGVIITSAKRTFAVGADLDQVYALTPRDAEGFADQIDRIKAAFRRLERLGRPVVAAINGTALGGGLELALACHHRVCADDPAIRLGLPEVSLGLLPGGGGIVRTVGLLGPEAALPLLLEGSRLTPEAALRAGLVDQVVPHDELVERARAWIRDNPGPRQPWDDPARSPAETDPQFFATATARLHARTHRTLPAPEKILACAAEASRTDVDTALQAETRALVEIATGQVAKNLIGVHWFQKNELGRGGSRPPGTPRTRVGRLAVIGAGMMGTGIAHVAARAGIDVVLTDVSAEAARRGRDQIGLLLDTQVARGRLTAAARAAIIDRITPGTDLTGCDLVIEAVFEDRQLKSEVLAAAEATTPPATMIASNTSTLPITGLAQGLQSQDRFIGMHFISPVEKMPLLEIVRGERTSPETVARALDFADQIGKTPIVVNDGPGFYTSRVFVSYTAEGAALLTEGVPAPLIENVARKAGMPVGPLAVSDDVSLATMLRVRRQNEADAAAAGRTLRYTTAYHLIARMVEDYGRPGRGGGAGFYDYPDAEPKRLWPGLAEHFGGDRPIPEQDVRDRLLFAQALETVRAVEDGIVTSTAAANVGSILALGFAPWTGGTLQYINQYGLRDFTSRADRLADSYGEHLRPPSLLRAKAERSEPF